MGRGLFFEFEMVTTHKQVLIFSQFNDGLICAHVVTVSDKKTSPACHWCRL